MILHRANPDRTEDEANFTLSLQKIWQKSSFNFFSYSAFLLNTKDRELGPISLLLQIRLYNLSFSSIVPYFKINLLKPAFSVQIPKVVNSSIFEQTTNDFVNPTESMDFPDCDLDSYFQNELITSRNKRMSERIGRILNETPHQSFFFALGAGIYLFFWSR